MDLKEFELMTKDEKVDFLIKERIDQLKAIDEQNARIAAQQTKEQVLAAFDAESLIAIEAVRVQRYKAKLVLAEELKGV